MTPVMSAIRAELALMSRIVETISATAVPPRVATSLAVAASAVALRAESALRCTVEATSSIAAAVCSRLEACSSVRCDRSMLPVAIWVEPVAMDSLLNRTSPTMRTRLSFIERSAASSCPVSSRARTSMLEVRSPAATVSATRTACAIGRVIERVSRTATPTASSTAITDSTIISVRAPRASAEACAPNSSMLSAWVSTKPSTAAR